MGWKTGDAISSTKYVRWCKIAVGTPDRSVISPYVHAPEDDLLGQVYATDAQTLGDDTICVTWIIEAFP